MKLIRHNLLLFCWLVTVAGRAQSPTKILGRFLTDSIEIGRPFRYALTYWHSPKIDLLFPDTARSFLPYRVQKVDVYATQTTGEGSTAISRDSAVYTLVSFETDSIQLLRVPVRVINDIDCTAQWSQTDTVFLRSKLLSQQPASTNRPTTTLATETNLVPLQQQFNYAALAKGLLSIGIIIAVLYALLGRAIRRRWRIYRLNRRHLRFLHDYNQLVIRLNSLTVSETANQAIVMWKIYLERLDRQPYISLTTPELAERMNDERVTDALREADRMIYGGTFSATSQTALWTLRDVATQTYHRSRARLQGLVELISETAQKPDSTKTSSFS